MRPSVVAVDYNRSGFRPEVAVATLLGFRVGGSQRAEQGSLRDSSAAVMRFAAGVWALIVACRTPLLLAGVVAGPWSAGATLFSPWVRLAEAAVFVASGSVLLLWGRADPRAWGLGAFLLDIANSLFEGILAADGQTAAIQLARNIHTNAFHGAALWFFAREFPAPPHSRPLRIAFAIGFFSACALGMLLLTVNVPAIADLVEASPALRDTLARGTSSSGTYWFWTLQYAWAAPGFLMMAYKLRVAGADDRRRFRLLTSGVCIGMAPIAIDVAIRTLSPAYNRVASRDPLRTLLGVVVYLSLAMLPVSAAYAAVVERALDVGLVVRAAAQHFLASNVIRAAAVAPLIGLMLVAYQHRDESVREFVAGPSSIVLFIVVVGLAAAATFHTRLLTAIDRRFFRERIDARDTLVSLSESVRRARTVDTLIALTKKEIVRALQPSSVQVALADELDALHLQELSTPPLPKTSVLVQLLSRSDLPMDVDRSDSSNWSRLGDVERRWLSEGGGSLLVPLRGSATALIGIIVLGPKKSELPYLADDRNLLATVGLAVSLALDRLLRGDSHGTASDDPAPASECVECGGVAADAIEVCECGGAFVTAALPLTVGDRLRVQRRIGSGGMGVVYSALDVRVHQTRAVKTLPRTDVALMNRLRREARALAAVSHPNIAQLHSLEVWRGRPVIVMELLPGGTLADRLRRGPLPVSQVLDLLGAIAGGVGAIHRAGILHRDIKPSNIGFSAEGTPKLFDFGLARVVPGMGSWMLADGQSTWSLSGATDQHQALRGTLAYLSPEMLRGDTATTDDDLWGLSVSALESVSGINPFRGETAAATVSRILGPDASELAVSILTGPAQDVFRSLLHPKRSSRPRTIDAWTMRLAGLSQQPSDQEML